MVSHFSANARCTHDIEMGDAVKAGLFQIGASTSCEELKAFWSAGPLGIWLPHGSPRSGLVFPILVKFTLEEPGAAGEARPMFIVGVVIKIRSGCPELLTAMSSGVTCLDPCCTSLKGASFDRGRVSGVSLSRSRRLRELPPGRVSL